MDQVKIRAAIAAHGLAKDAEVTVAATPIVEGAISNGVFVELERAKAEPQDGEDDETPVAPIEEVQLPGDGEPGPNGDQGPDGVTDPADTKPKASTRRRG